MPNNLDKIVEDVCNLKKLSSEQISFLQQQNKDDIIRVLIVLTRCYEVVIDIINSGDSISSLRSLSISTSSKDGYDELLIKKILSIILEIRHTD
jgi:hypothetical protein